MEKVLVILLVMTLAITAFYLFHRLALSTVSGWFSRIDTGKTCDLHLIGIDVTSGEIVLRVEGPDPMYYRSISEWIVFVNDSKVSVASIDPPPETYVHPGDEVTLTVPDIVGSSYFDVEIYAPRGAHVKAFYRG